MSRTERSPGDRRGWLLLGSAGVLGMAAVAMIAALVVERRGNLAWDDADYLRRGLRLARLSGQEPLALLDEGPKPPLYVGWIGAASLAVGRDRIEAILVVATAVPFGLLLAATTTLARSRGGAGAGLIAMALVVASPMALAYAAKVMVETMFSLWLLAAMAAASATVRAPCGRAPWLLGAAIGLMAMTKATVALFLPGIALFLIASPAVRGLSGKGRRRLIARVLVPVALIAGPWHAKHGPEAIRFARHASNYVVDVEGRESGTSIWSRPLGLAGQVAGWPVVATVAVVALGRRRDGRPGTAGLTATSDAFGRLTAVTLGIAGFILLIPSHFDPRFLMPIWPSVAVALAGWLAAASAGRPALRAALVIGLASGPVLSTRSLLSEPPRTTPWAAASLIDDLRERYGVRSIVNVGDAPDWNVCKTGLVNELRDDPDDCFVLHDLSRLAGPALGDRLGRADAAFVLDPAAAPAGFAIAAPGLNRAWDELGDRPELAGFERVGPTAIEGLPPMAVLVRRDLIERSKPRRGAGPGVAMSDPRPAR